MKHNHPASIPRTDKPTAADAGLAWAALVDEKAGLAGAAEVADAELSLKKAQLALKDAEAALIIANADYNQLVEGTRTPVSDIARQLMEVSPVVRRSLRVAFGGGRDYFRHTGQTDPEYGGRTDH